FQIGDLWTNNFGLDNPRQSPQARHAVPAAGLPQAHEELPHPPGSVHFPRLPVQDAHAVDQRTLWPSLPGIEATPTDLEHLTQPRHAKLPLLGLDELVLHDDSLAKYLALFFKISRSSVMCASSRFSRAISVVRSFRVPDPGNAPAPRVWNSRCHL